ncbi:restriction endonuclease subunit S [Lactococcus cremoris]|uniref:restriction endonuclease subunit S n=1 Tax=Lactococcus lactis subsp. cremoris TaxID=1359 RepID=UPI002FC71427
MKEKVQAPELRFPGFTDDWEERKLGDITKISTGKLDANAMVENGKYDFYTSGIKKYRIDVAAFEGPSITIAGNGATVGYMHLADNKFNAYQRTYVLQEFLVDRSFIFSEIGNKLPKKIKQEARTGNIPYIVMDMLTELKLSIPQNNSEQQKIGSFFKQLDDTIDLHQRKLDLLKEQKKGYLQKMFPKNGAKVPELRFAGFADDWEERKFQWLIDQNIIDSPIDGNHGEKHPKSSDYVESGIPFLMAKDIKNNKVDIKNCTFISKETAEALDKGFAKNGDILLTHKATIGEVGILEGVNTEYAMLTPQITYYRILDFSRLDRNFFSSVLRSSVFQKNIHKIAKQSTRPYVGITEQRKLTIYFPIKIEEQQKIGSFFKQIDETIALHQRKLDLLKEQKKGFLQKMFV